MPSLLITAVPRAGRRSRAVLGAVLAFALTAGVTATAGAPSAGAATIRPQSARAAPASLHATSPAGNPLSSASLQRAEDTHLVARAVAATTATFTVSSAVHRFLTTGLGLPLGSSRTLRGPLSSGTLTVTTGAPRSLGLPATVPLPSLRSTTLRVSTSTGTLTIAAAASGSSLSVTIPHANTSTLGRGAASGHLTLPTTLLGEKVSLAGSLAVTSSAPTVSLSGVLTAHTVTAGVLAVASGTVSAVTGSAVRVTGQATIGRAPAAAQVTLSGSLPSSSTWSLTATPASTTTSWSPFARLSFVPRFTGTVTDRAGAVSFSLASSTATTWYPNSATNDIADAVTSTTYADTTAPSGSPAIAAGTAWVAVNGTLAVPAAKGTTLALQSRAVIGLAAGTDTITAIGSGSVDLPWTPTVELSGVQLAGTGQVGTSTDSVTLAGSGTIAVGSEARVPATIDVQDGDLVVDFTGTLADFGLADTGTGTVLYAAAALPDWTDPSGATVALPAGFASSQGAPATQPTSGQHGYTVSAAAEQFLDGLGLGLTSTTLDGTTSGSSLTVPVSAPTLPVSLPTGDLPITFGPATLTIDTAADTLTLTAEATATGGTAAQLSVTIDHVSQTTLGGADLSATVTVSGLSLLGADVDLSGTLSWTGGKVAASLTGTLQSDLVVAAGVATIDSGTTVSLSTATGLTVSGSIDLGAAPSVFTVSFTGSISDLKNWSLQISDDGTAPTFTPLPGLTLTPDFTGTVQDTDGTVGFDVNGKNVLTWAPSSTVSVGVTNVELSDETPPSDLSCPADLQAGQVFAAVTGTASYTPSDADVNLSGTVQACVVPAASSFQITGAVTGSLVPSTAGFGISNINLSVAANLSASTFSVSASADVTIQSTDIQVGISFASDGSFVAGASVADLSSLGLAGTNGYLLFANKAVKAFDPSTLGLTNADGSAITPFDLPAGITVTMAFVLTGQTLQAIQKLGVPLDGATVRLMATLSSSGFAVKILVDFGNGNQGFRLIQMPNGLELDLNTLSIGFDVTEAATTLSIGGTAYLAIPSVIPGDDQLNSVEVGINGTIDITDFSFSFGFTLAGACGQTTCTWTNAFGIEGLDVDELAGSIGVDFETTPVPTPTFSLNVDNLVLPPAWASAIGMVPGSSVSLALVVDVTAPVVDISIAPPAGGTVALQPLSIFTKDPSVVNELEIGQAHLLFAPLGGLEADGTMLNPGVDLTFDATIAGVQADVQAGVDLDPTDPSITAHVTVSSFAIGSFSLAGPQLNLSISPQAADFSFTGGFTDYTTGISFGATVDLGASVSDVGASVALTVSAGLPSFLEASGTLNGQIDVDPTSGNLTVSASGSFAVVIGGQTVTSVSASWSSDGATIWRDLNDDAAVVAAAIVAAGQSVQYAISVLQSLGFDLAQIEQAISSGFALATGTLVDDLVTAGYSLDSTVQTAIDTLGATANDLAAALNGLGWDASSIAESLQGYFGSSSAAVYNALLSIGDTGSSVLSAITSLFNNGSYDLWVGDAPDVLEVPGGSQSAGTGIDQWAWNGGTNQDWYVLATDSGYAELVNRNSGQCLTVPQFTTNPIGLEQFPCTGEYLQQWYVGDASSLSGQTEVLTNRYSGLVVDVTGGGIGLGTPVEQYPANGGSNQNWYFTPAA